MICATAHARTARQVPDGAALRQLIDNHVLEMVVNDQLYRLETLLINAYDHLVDVRGTKRNKTAVGIAQVKQLSHFIRFLSEHDKYKVRTRHGPTKVTGYSSSQHASPLLELT